MNYDGRDGRRHGRGHSYSDGYGGSSDLPSGDSYGNYGSSQVLFLQPFIFSKILSVDEFCLVNYFFSIHCYNYCFICGSLVEVLLMELMEVMLRDGLALLGNQFILFLCSMFNYYYSVFQVSTFFPLHTAKRLLSLIFSSKCLITRQY